jgi:hypothetical protein
VDPVTITLIEHAIVVRDDLLAQSLAVSIAARALEGVRAELPPTHAASWRGAAAQAEAHRVHEVSSRLDLAIAQLRAAADALQRDIWTVNLHVG